MAKNITQKWAVSRKWFIGFCALVLIVSSSIYYNRIDDRYPTMVSSYELCDLKQYAQIADALEISYTFDYSRHAIGIEFHSDPNNRFSQFHALNDKYNKDKYDNTGQQEYAYAMAYDSTSPPICHLDNVKTHVDNINANLLSYIPNDVDHVSYHPTQDKAVYCYYLQGEKGGSRCFYIRLDQGKLTTDDISDIERANLETMVKRYPHVSGFRNKQVKEFDSVHSAVIDWTDRPSTLLYGITLATFEGINDFSWAVADY